MATSKPRTKTATRRSGKIAASKASIAGMADKLSTKVASEHAAGTRPLPPESLVELPAGTTPLDVMIMAMRRAYLLGGSMAAAPYAERAAPYIHAKISSIELKNPLTGQGASGKPTPFQVQFVDPKDTP